MLGTNLLQNQWGETGASAYAPAFAAWCSIGLTSFRFRAFAPDNPPYPPTRAKILQKALASRRITLRHKVSNTNVLSGPVRDTPPYRAIPFRGSITEGGIAPICLVFIGYRGSIAEIPLLRGGSRTSTSHVLQGGNGKRGRGYRTQLAMLRHQKNHSAQARGVSLR